VFESPTLLLKKKKTEKKKIKKKKISVSPEVAFREETLTVLLPCILNGVSPNDLNYLGPV
jgi:hypothetical protein